jgi:ribonuclease HI
LATPSWLKSGWKEFELSRVHAAVFVVMSANTGPKKVTIHTDGGCEGNPGPGGWAAVLRSGSHARELAGGEPATTNNRMELQAAIAALSALKETCEVTLFTDSEYLRQGITEWLPLWKVNRWRTVERKAVKNEDLWRLLDDVAARHQITWQWVKGHAGHPDNELCDRLAAAEIKKIVRGYTPDKLAELRAEFVASRDPHRNQGKLF